MSSEDTRVWARFLEQRGGELGRVRYDVKVGAGHDLGEGADPVMGSMWSDLVKKRVDAVCVVDGVTWLVEVKPVGGMSALGQLLVYADLFRAQESPQGAVQLVLVCGRVDRDCAATFVRLGVVVYEVGT